MKNIIHSLTFSLVMAALFILSSCSGGDRAIFRVMPETTSGVVTFNPKNLMDKGKINDLDFVKKAAGHQKIVDRLINNPESTGINPDAYSAFFVFGKDPSYGCFIVPLKSKSRFKSFLDTIQAQPGLKFEERQLGSYTELKHDNLVVAWNNSVAFVLSSFSGWAGNDLDTVALRLTKTRRSESLLTDKDFNKFLSRQRDINAWLTSTNLMNIAGAGALGHALDLFGGLKNNYGHIFLDFGKGEMTLRTNLQLNASMKETIDKYNFLDRDAGKDLLKYLPEKDVFLVANTNLDPDKILGLLDFLGKQTGDQLGRMEDKLGVDENDLKHALQGEVAFSINGIRKRPTMKESDIYGDSSFTRNIPVFVAALKLQNENAWKALTQKLKEESGLTEQNGYYSLSVKLLPLFLAEQDKNLIVTNSETYIREIASQGQVQQNILSADFAPVLTSRPVCFYVNLDRKSYSKEMEAYLEEKMGANVHSGVESFGKSLKSLSLTANLEEWELQVELNDKENNSLYTLLRDL